jgi:hypothetical protein
MPLKIEAAISAFRMPAAHKINVENMIASGVGDDDLRVIAKHGYEGVLSTDADEQARALSLFIADMLAARRLGNGVTAVAASLQ